MYRVVCLMPIPYPLMKGKAEGKEAGAKNSRHNRIVHRFTTTLVLLSVPLSVAGRETLPQELCTLALDQIAFNVGTLTQRHGKWCILTGIRGSPIGLLRAVP